MKLTHPLDIALVGTGFRARTVYHTTFAPLRDRGVRLVAVCDPEREHADAFAESLGVPAFYSLQDLVRARPMEAVVSTAPNPLNYAISCYLSEHGIPHIVETSMAATLSQAQAMVHTARKNNVIFRVGEQFFRLPFARIAKKVAQTGFLGPIRRIISTHDHTGHHQLATWVVFYGTHPESVRAIEHTMPVTPFHSMSIRFHEQETFVARFYTFPGNCLVVDMTSNGKGLLGRYPRPGYTQYEGERGTIVWRAAGRWNGPLHQGEGEVRYCSDEALKTNGVCDTVFPIVQMSLSDLIRTMSVRLPGEHIEYVNPFYDPDQRPYDVLNYYHAAVAEHILDFAQAVRGEAKSEFTDEDALMTFTAEVAVRESALRGGELVPLPLRGDIENLESEKLARKTHLETYGVDPLDVEGMLNKVIPRG